MMKKKDEDEDEDEQVQELSVYTNNFSRTVLSLSDTQFTHDWSQNVVFMVHYARPETVS